MTALKKIQQEEATHVSLFEGAHTGLISSTCYQGEFAQADGVSEAGSGDKHLKKISIFDGCATGLISSTC